MFDIGFWELSMIMLVALLVIGPERLPRVARQLGAWAGRARRFLSDVKADIDRELAAEELKKILEQQKSANPMHEIIETTRETVEEVKSGLQEGGAEPSSSPPSTSEGKGAPAGGTEGGEPVQR